MSKKPGKSFILQDRKNTIDMNNYTRILSNIKINKDKVLDYQEQHIKKIIYDFILRVNSVSTLPVCALHEQQRTLVVSC
jgi:hypothetical protein